MSKKVETNDFTDDVFQVYYPEIFTKFHSYFSLGEWPIKIWSQDTFGNIPEYVEKINADLEILNTNTITHILIHLASNPSQNYV